ncbi:hypothetical protein BD626DRAFT_625810 [Schizophyllum amplum]|uniref:F-box domain-containing protein n=1 Tax=Schizophyllum amplum TaxID=97359 RepID=A0A550CR98_9AGAR|nr:hypothetical protein BD626DRAFT_625810 [Auriculariopsis ampla]
MAHSFRVHLDALASIRSSILEQHSHFDDADIKDLENGARLVLCAVRAAWNSRVSANTLPAEILERIFELLQPRLGDFVPSSPGRASLHWTAVTRVSSRWRTIALAYRALWSTIDLCHNHPAAAGQAFLARSDGAPLAVFFSSKDLRRSVHDRKVLEEISAHHIPHLEQLHVVCDRVRDIYRVCGLFQCAAPRLQSLSICFRHRYLNDQFHRGAPVFFGGEHPALRKLAVYHCPIWQFNAPSTLTHLAVGYTRRHVGDTHIALIEASPNLEQLAVETYGPFQGSDTTIPLNRLRALQWSRVDSSEEVALSRLVIPETCQLSISIHLPLVAVGLSSSLSPSNFRPLAQPIHTVQLCTAKEAEHLTVYSGTMFLESGRNATLPTFSFHLEPDSRLIVILSDYRYSHTSQEWAKFLLQMSPIRDLSIINDTIYPLSKKTAILDALCSATPVQGACPDTVVLPCLQTLRIYGVGSAIWPRLWSVVAYRARSDVPLREMHVHEDPPQDSINAERDGTPGSLQKITLDASGTPLHTMTKESALVAADIAAQIIQDAYLPDFPMCNYDWAYGTEDDADEEEEEE